MSAARLGHRGITQARKTATLCEIFGVKTAFQEGGRTTGQSTRAYHVDISTPAFGIQEENQFPEVVHEMLPERRASGTDISTETGSPASASTSTKDRGEVSARSKPGRRRLPHGPHARRRRRQALITRRGGRPSTSAVEQNPVTHSRFIGHPGKLESHQPAVGRNDRVRGLVAFVVVEDRQALKVLAGAVELELPDVDIARAALAAEFLALPVRLDQRVLTIGKMPSTSL